MISVRKRSANVGQQLGFVCAKAKRQHQSAQSERKSTTLCDEPTLSKKTLTKGIKKLHVPLLANV